MADIDCHEEQSLEIEALESIFISEFELVTENPVTYEIIVNADREDEDSNFVVIKVKVEYPEEYPKVMPKFQFKNLSPKNLNISDFNHCHDIYKQTAENMLGEQMVFEIIENIRSFLIEKNDVFVNARVKEAEEKKIADDNLGKKFIAEQRLDYTPVNKDTFSEWLAKYQKEMKAIKDEEYKNRSKDQVERDSRKTGKSYFMEKQGMVGSNIAFEEDDLDQIIDNDEEEKDDEMEDQSIYFENEELFDDDDIDDVELD